MEQLTSLVNRFELFANQHVPQSWLANGVPIAILLLLGGITLSVLGAKLARLGMTAGFIGVGVGLGIYFSRLSGLNVVVCSLIGAAVIGLIGHLTFRVWVGTMAAVVAACLALSVFSQQRLYPQWVEFDQQTSAVSMIRNDTNNTVAGFSVPTPRQQQAMRSRTPQQWGQEFLAHVETKDPGALRLGRAVAIASLAAGLLIGLLASKTTLIVATSLLGTIFVFGSVAALLSRCLDDGYQAFLQRPELAGVLAAGFFFTSLVFQFVLNRKAATPETKAKSKS